MKKISTICILFLLIIFSACTKDNPAPGTSGSQSGYFFANTEWTGTAATYGQLYQQPCYLRFNGDTTVSVYVLFTWMLNSNYVDADSAVGKITGIDTVTNGITTIQVSFPRTSDQQVYYITNQNSLKSTSASNSTVLYNNAYSTNLQRCPATVPSVKGTSWNTNKMVGGPTDGMYEFPDISSFSFGTNNSTEYTRNGHIITYTPTDHIQLLLYEYNQQGPRVYFAGFNETNSLLIGFYGVLSADGKTILADTRAKQDARLPNYLQTIYWYGPPGVTPHTQKQ